MIHHHSSGKRRLWKRIFSMCIALILICGMTVPASSVSASSITDGVSEEVETTDGKTALNETASGETETVSGTTEMEASESKTDDSATQPDETTPEGTDGSETDNSETNDSETNDSGETAPTATVTYTFYVDGEVYNTQTLKDGETLTAPADPEADGKIFDGWYTAETDGEKFTAFGVQTVTETKTVDLYAGWLTDAESESGSTSESTEETPGEEAGNQEETQSGETSSTTDGSVEKPSDILENANGDISTLEITGLKTVEVGETIKLSGGGRRGYNHNWKWESPNEGKVSFNQNPESTAEVTGLKAGTVTITHTYSVWYGLWSEDYTEIYELTVTEPLAEGEYKLYIYTLVPGMTDESPAEVDKKWNGMGVGTISGVDSPEDYPNSTIIDNGYGNSGAVIDYASERYPDIEVEGSTYQYAADGTPEATTKGYYTIDWMRVIVSDGANAGKNGYNPVVESGTPTFHLDGVITVNAENLYTVQFKLKDAGEEEFLIVDPVKYSKLVENNYPVRELDRPDTNEPNVYPQTKTVDGITYTFSGWYYDEACTEPVNWETGTITQNTVFYAKYTPQGQNITVTKDVTGGLGDVQKEFKFTYQIKNASGTVLDSGEFTLKDKDVNNSSSYPIQNVPVGSTLIITETNAGGYFTSTKYNGKNIIALEDKDSEEKNLEIPIVNGKGDIVITNNKEPIPDTGVHLTSLPYIMTLSFVLAGTAVITVNKYRRRDS